MTNKMYDRLKWVAQILIPALMTFYGVVATALGIPYTETVLTIAGALDAFLGTLLGLSSRGYYKRTEDATDGK